MKFTVLMRKGEDFGYVAECPAIPGCVSQGVTLAAARRNIRDAIKSCLEVMTEDAMRKKRSSSSRIIHIAV